MKIYKLLGFTFMLFFFDIASAEDIFIKGQTISIDELNNLVNQVTQLQNELEKIKTAQQNTVVAFSAGRCPDGWERFQDGDSKFIRGAGPGLDVNSSGGKASVILTNRELPPHNHRMQTITGIRPSAHKENFPLVRNPIPGNNNPGERKGEVNTFDEGTGAEFAVIPPYITLLFCKKQAEF